LGRWHLRRRLGGGATGWVYAAEDDHGAAAAVKILHPQAANDAELLARFRREIHLGARLRHPGLVTVLDHGESKGLRFLAMELADGESLERRIPPTGLPWAKVGPLAEQLLHVVGHLHAHGVIHRDIKPGNLQIEAGGHLRLLDLGYAKHRDESDTADKQELTLTGSALGSPAYMAPEQILDSSQADERSDLYGCGATLYHLLTGHLPYDGRTAMAVMEAVLAGPPQPPASLPAGVAAALAWLMAREPSRRPQDAAEAAAVIVQLMHNPDDRSAVPGAAATQRSNVLLMVLCGMLAAGVGLGLWLWLRGG
jgi:serine/threonine protein kinase